MAESGREVAVPTSNFIRSIIDTDLSDGKHQTVVTRFPPEPNGYLHIGHAKSICLNFGLAKSYKGRCHLRFDDTNPLSEDVEYVDSIMNDVRWLGFDWGENLFHASDYYQKLYDFAVKMVRDGTAYVCSLNEQEIRDYRGSVTEPGRPSPYRERSVDENMALLERMKAGEFEDGAHVLRARVDMANPNMKMRDPLIYRIRKAHHYRTGDDWCIYPLYDFAHGLSDSIEGVTHSLCTLEFENNRELYDWFLVAAGVEHRPQQIEFARLGLSYTVMSKRKLLRLVQEGHVAGWDDPRMTTIAGLRRRGVTASAIRAFCERIGVSKANSLVEWETLEYAVREDLNERAPRVMAVVDPIKLVLENYPADQEEMLEGALWPKDAPETGNRQVPFCREIWIERSDFMEKPDQNFRRLSPGAEVRLRFGYIVKCTDVVRGDDGQILELRGHYDPDSKSGTSGSNRKVKGTIHWVSAKHAVAAELRLYEHLFSAELPDASADFASVLNPNSLTVVQAMLEPHLRSAPPSSHWQFERQGYFFVDPVDSTTDKPIFNRVVGLRDSFTKPASLPVAKKPEVAPPVVSVAAAPRELTAQEQGRFAALVERGLGEGEARVLALDASAHGYFEDAAKGHSNAAGVAKWLVNLVLREVKQSGWDGLKVRASALGDLVSLVDSGDISSTVARKVFEELVLKGGDPKEIVTSRGLAQVSDEGALELIIDQILAANPGEVERYREGNKRLIGFFIGQVMQATKGQANAGLSRELLVRKLG